MNHFPNEKQLPSETGIFVRYLRAHFHPREIDSITVRQGQDQTTYRANLKDGDSYSYGFTRGEFLELERYLTNRTQEQPTTIPLSPIAKPLPRLRKLVLWADLMPLDLRKRLKAMAGDYSAEIARLQLEGRHKTANWNTVLAYGYAGWYVLRGPLDGVVGLLMKNLKGH